MMMMMMMMHRNHYYCDSRSVVGRWWQMMIWRRLPPSRRERRGCGRGREIPAGLKRIENIGQEIRKRENASVAMIVYLMVCS